MPKESKKQFIEVKFKNKQEIAISKKELKMQISKLKAQILKVKEEEVELKLKIKKEKNNDKRKLQKDKMINVNSLKNKKDLIYKNSFYIKKQINANKKQLKLIKLKEKNIIIENRNKQKEELAKIKDQIKLEKHKQSKLLYQTKKTNKEKIINTKQKLLDEKIKLSELKITTKKLIHDRKTNLLKDKNKYSFTKKEEFFKTKLERKNRLSKIKQSQNELKQLIIDEKEKYNQKILAIKNQEFIDKNQFQELKNIHKQNIDKIKDDFVIEKIKTNQEDLEPSSEENTINNIESKENTINNIESKENTINNIESKENLNPKINISEFNQNVESYNTIKGARISAIDKRGLKKINEINKKESKLKIEKLNFNLKFIENIKKFQKLKKEKNLIDIREFAKYVTFITNEEFTNEQIETIILSIIFDILKGKVFAFLEGYFYLFKTRGLKIIKFSKNLPKKEKYIISLQNEKIAQVLEQRIFKSLNNEGVIQILNNIAIKKDKDQMLVLIDLPFMK